MFAPVNSSLTPEIQAEMVPRDFARIQLVIPAGATALLSSAASNSNESDCDSRSVGASIIAGDMSIVRHRSELILNGPDPSPKW